jgi:hypothetical protein
VALATAFSNWFASGTSTIEHSSATSTSHSSGDSSLRLNCPLAGLTSSSRWIVFASSPVDSDNRLAARPVGAHNSAFTCFARRIVSIELTSVVFPTPGPPVMTNSFDERARRIACFWLSASWIASFCSTHGIALSASNAVHGGDPDCKRFTCETMERSALYKGARKTLGTPSTVSATTTSSASSWSIASSMTSCGISSSFTASDTSWLRGKPQWPSPAASDNA